MKKRALVSVTNKAGIVQFCKALVELGWEIVSTGGTAKALRDGGVPCIEVADVTGWPEMFDGRVRTLHPKVFGPILFDRNIPAHQQTAEEYELPPIDMVVVNLYDFVSLPSINEIDVGGPSMLCAAAKNHRHVIPVCDRNDYEKILSHLRTDGYLDLLTREILASKVFLMVSVYYGQIYDHIHTAHKSGRPLELGKHH